MIPPFVQLGVLATLFQVFVVSGFYGYSSSGIPPYPLERVHTQIGLLRLVYSSLYSGN